MSRYLCPLACLLSIITVIPLAPACAAGNSAVYPAVEHGRTLTFPGDHGAHPEFRTEWWYVTGWLESDGIERGFQVTFFRTRTGLQEENESGFAPTQLIFAHAAIADTEFGSLRHDQRAARAGFGLAYANVNDTLVAVDDWSLIRSDGVYRTRIVARDFVLDLRLSPTQPVILQGDAGYSRKGPQRAQASYYYSLPKLRVSGSMEIENETHTVSGEAWLDHEWSSQYLPADAQGWDWAGINLSDGGALMVFRMRGDDGKIILPDAFLPAAARFGLMTEIDFWIIRHAAMAYVEHSRPDRVIKLSINLSAHAFENDDLTDFVEETFKEHNVLPTDIILEITESLAVRRPMHVERQIAVLRQLGCQFALDDFGTGYSSFGYLQKLKFDYIKIDGSFVSDLMNNPVDQKMIKLIAEIGKEAGMRTIAEYVQDARSLERLSELGVDMAQGYFVGRPTKLPKFKSTPISLNVRRARKYSMRH